jgi:hypothetical protein
VPSKPKRVPRALSVAEVRQLRAWLTYDDKAIERDLPDLADMLVATGLRVGECLAVTWDAHERPDGSNNARQVVTEDQRQPVRQDLLELAEADLLIKADWRSRPSPAPARAIPQRWFGHIGFAQRVLVSIDDERLHCLSPCVA